MAPRFPAPLIGALQLALHDFVDWGKSRPFFDVGGVISPSQRRFRYQRSYTSSVGLSQMASDTRSSDYAVFERVGWVFRASPRDEVAVAGELRQVAARTRLSGKSPSHESLQRSHRGRHRPAESVKAGAQWTHLFGSLVEVNLNGGFVQSFSNTSGASSATVTGIGTINPTSEKGTPHWGEYGARVGFTDQANGHTLFVNGTVGPSPVGNTIPRRCGSACSLLAACWRNLSRWQQRASTEICKRKSAIGNCCIQVIDIARPAQPLVV